MNCATIYTQKHEIRVHGSDGVVTIAVKSVSRSVGRALRCTPWYAEAVAEGVAAGLRQSRRVVLARPSDAHGRVIVRRRAALHLINALRLAARIARGRP